MTGNVEGKQAFSHEVVRRRRLLNLERRPYMKLSQDRKRQETCLDLPQGAAKAKRITAHALSHDCGLIEVPMTRMGSQRQH
jgi:hypothetical protein